MTQPDGFAELGVPARYLSRLAELGANTPFPIQELALPPALQGRDVVGRARTGSGKTLAFSVPACEHARTHRNAARRPSALIVAPTRELAAQIGAVTTALGGADVTTAVVYGGVPQGPQVRALRDADVVVACPGRLEDLAQQGHVELGAVGFVVLDEADHMADLGFLPAVRRIIAATAAGGQRLLFSATLDGDTQRFVDQHTTNPVECSVAGASLAAATHRVDTVAEQDRVAHIVELAGGAGRTIVFCRTKHRAKKLCRNMNLSGVNAVELHGNLSQPRRTKNLAALKTGAATVLVATDIAARGIHVDDVELVVHADTANDVAAYVHRSGRTARAGAGGLVVTVTSHDDTAAARALVSSATALIGRTEPVAPAKNSRRNKEAPSQQRRSAPTPARASATPVAGTAHGEWVTLL